MRRLRRNDTLDYFEGKARILRMSAKRHVGFSNGNAISHISLLFAMERYGWPYVAPWEEVRQGRSSPSLAAGGPPLVARLQDATPDFNWHMYYECLALTRGELLSRTLTVRLPIHSGGTPGLLHCLQRRVDAWVTWQLGRRISETPGPTSSRRAWRGSMGGTSGRREALWAA